MKKFTKTMVAVALLAGAGAANAAIVTDSADGNGNQLFLVAYDPNGVNADLSVGRTYNLNTGVTFGALVTNAASALSSFATGFNLAADANWTSFASTITNPSAVKYLLTVGNSTGGANGFGLNDHLFTTGSLTANVDPSVNLTGNVTGVKTHAAEVNVGLGANASSLIKDLPLDGSGQANGLSGPLNSLWGGLNDPTGTYGLATSFFFGGSHNITVPGPRGTTRIVEGFTAADIQNLGTFLLSGNTLKFTSATVSQVPLPAAVWMFGAGLMGVLRSTRRKSVQA